MPYWLAAPVGTIELICSGIVFLFFLWLSHTPKKYRDKNDEELNHQKYLNDIKNFRDKNDRYLNDKN